ncbi:MAG TPA: hypothetical protein VD913_04100 [bacterium]|nr:hypothetical protein [bacterium]
MVKSDDNPKKSVKTFLVYAFFLLSFFILNQSVSYATVRYDLTITNINSGSFPNGPVYAQIFAEVTASNTLTLTVSTTSLLDTLYGYPPGKPPLKVIGINLNPAFGAVTLSASPGTYSLGTGNVDGFGSFLQVETANNDGNNPVILTINTTASATIVPESQILIMNNKGYNAAVHPIDNKIDGTTIFIATPDPPVILPELPGGFFGIFGLLMGGLILRLRGRALHSTDSNSQRFLA